MDFSELYQRHASSVFRVALWMTGNRAEAEDIVSETFVRAWAGVERLRTETVRAYLLTIARNLVHQHRRKGVRAETTAEDVDSRPGPERRALARSRLRLVNAALSRFSEVDQILVTLHCLEGLSYKDAARAAGISVGAAKVRVHRARLRLARILEEES